VHLCCALGVLLAAPAAAVPGEPSPVEVLHIGTSGSLAAEATEKEKGALETLQDFIKSETGLNNDIVRLKDWSEVAGIMFQKQLNFGGFRGYEFAWAQENQPQLKPLSLAVNGSRYPIAHVVTRKEDPASDFAGLRGHSLAIPSVGAGFLRLFVERQGQA